MRQAVDDEIGARMRQAMDRRWPGARIAEIVALKGDASSRRFWRVTAEPHPSAPPPTLIALDLGPEDLPRYARALGLLREPLAEPPYLNVHRFLTSIGVAVPELYWADVGSRLLLVEDVGALSLFEAAAADPTQAGRLYRLAIDELLLLHVDGTRRSGAGCLAFSVAYDERLFAWEMEQFIKFGLARVAPGADAEPIGRELASIAAALGRSPRVLSHRDYHGRNLFVQPGPRIRVIDFQDALLAPAAQDLAVLLTTRDTAGVITPALESELLGYYLAELPRRGEQPADAARFAESYRLCVLQHALKAIGRFVYLSLQGKPQYAAYLPDCVAQARRVLAATGGFPRLREVLAGC